MTAYRFKGYWKDVGTIQSLWDANMDMLDVNNLTASMSHDKEWQIFARNPIRPPHMTGASAIVSDSLVTDGCKIYGDVEHLCCSTPSPWKRALPSRTPSLCRTRSSSLSAVVDHAIVAENAVVGASRSGGRTHQDGSRGVVVVAEGVEPKARRRGSLTAPCAPNLRKVVTRNDHSAARHILFAYRDNPHLRELTSHRTVASIPFGGRYRMIDFMLSTWVNAHCRHRRGHAGEVPVAAGSSGQR